MNVYEAPLTFAEHHIDTLGQDIRLAFIGPLVLWFRRQRAVNSVINCGIWQKFKLNLAFMYVLMACENKEDPIKTEGARVATTCKSMGIFLHAQMAELSDLASIRTL